MNISSFVMGSIADSATVITVANRGVRSQHLTSSNMLSELCRHSIGPWTKKEIQESMCRPNRHGVKDQVILLREIKKDVCNQLRRDTPGPVISESFVTIIEFP